MVLTPKSRRFLFFTCCFLALFWGATLIAPFLSGPTPDSKVYPIKEVVLDKIKFSITPIVYPTSLQVHVYIETFEEPQFLTSKLEDHVIISINDSCIFIKGKPSDRDERGDTLKMVADDVFPLAQAREKLSHHINVMIDSGQTDEGLLETLKDLSEKNKGRLGLILHLKAKNGTVQRIRARTTGLNASKDFVKNLRDVFRDSHVWIS